MKNRDPIVRPIQYLGSKLRVVDQILSAIPNLPKSSRVMDLFSGTSVVSQAFARAGHDVTAVDAMPFCATLARACLGIGYRSNDQPERHLTSLWNSLPPTLALETFFEEQCKLEQQALESGDPSQLLNNLGKLPQSWTSDAVRALANDIPVESDYKYGIVSSNYAGTYFGLRQALDLDRLLFSISVSDLSSWSRDVLKSACMHAASLSSFSAGKHFAQYHQVEGKTSSFHGTRILADRRRSIVDDFVAAASTIANAGRRNHRNHAAYGISMESLFSTSLPRHELVYADPPYTTQQYSRFYHVLEVIDAGETPDLSRAANGKVTRGLYPEGRFKSRFCSRAKAGLAFRDLAAFAANHVMSESLVISYSLARGAISGNARNISIDELLEACSEFFPVVQSIELGHRYRNFNAIDVESKHRELLLICKR